MHHYPILLYDIDGTILNVEREFIIGIIETQLSQLNIKKNGTKSRSFAGRTDRGIFTELIGDTPDAEEIVYKLMDTYADAMAKRLTAEHITIHDGVLDSISIAADRNIPMGLCTGNIRQVAMKKVQTAGLRDRFSFGAYGEVSANRNDLPGEADKNYRAMFDSAPAPEQYIIIGDTPNDIRCAKHFGARSVAVTTGGFSREELAEHQPDLVLDSLHDPVHWLNKLGFTI